MGSKPSAVKTLSAPVQSAPASVTTDVAVPAPAPVPGREGARAGTNLLRRSVAAIWRARPIMLGLIGLACALYGQKLVTDGKEQAVVLSIRWYTVGIILVLIAWAGTYKNKSLLRLPDPSVTTTTHRTPTTDYHQRIAYRLRTSWRYLLAFAALGLNLFSASLLRADYYSAVGGWGRLASLVLLLAAFIGHRPNPNRSRRIPRQRW